MLKRAPWGAFAIFVIFCSIRPLAQQTFAPISLFTASDRSAISLLLINLPYGRTISSLIGSQQAAVPGFWLISGQNVTADPQEEQNAQLGIDKNKIVHSQSNNKTLPPPILAGIPCKKINVGRGTQFLPDLVLVDQNGRKTRFYTDLIKGKTVLISFFYTSCGYTCLRQGKVFADLQKELGDRLGKDVFLISVTMDPETDTPDRLKIWGTRYGLRKGWTLVTGGKVEMSKLVSYLTGNPLGKIETHSSFIYLGNDKKNKWIVTYGLTAPKNLVKQIEEL